MRTEEVAFSAMIGASTYTDFGSVSKALVNTGPTRLVGLYYFFGGTPSPSFFQLFNKATAPVATDVPRFSLRVASSTGSPTGLGPLIPIAGIEFPLGVGFAWSSTLATFTDGCTLTAPVAVHAIFKPY
jgi:hypothetical protein